MRQALALDCHELLETALSVVSVAEIILLVALRQVTGLVGNPYPALVVRCLAGCIAGSRVRARVTGTLGGHCVHLPRAYLAGVRENLHRTWKRLYPRWG